MTLRELLDRIGPANAVVGLFAALFAVLIIGAGFDFDANKMIEIVITAALALAALGLAAALPYITGRILAELRLTSSDD